MLTLILLSKFCLDTEIIKLFAFFLVSSSTIVPMGSPTVHPELLGGDTESDQIEKSSNPTVEGVLIITVFDISFQHPYVGVRLFLQLNVFDESNTD